jgi:hypothetical protein
LSSAAWQEIRVRFGRDDNSVRNGQKNEYKQFFIPFGGPKAHDNSVEKHFLRGVSGTADPSASLGMTKGGKGDGLDLAWSVFHGVLFCALLLWRYDEYTQNMKSYTLPWHSTVFACGFPA